MTNHAQSNKAKKSHHEPRPQPPSPTPVEDDICRLEDMCALPDGRIAIADHANGILIFATNGALVCHLNGPQDTLAFGVRSNPVTNELVALILDVPGWTVNIYNAAPEASFSLVDQILIPVEPPVPRLKLRWLAVNTDGELFVTAGGVVWKLRDRAAKEWSMIHKDPRPEVWFSHITKIPGSTDRFLVCCNGDCVVEMKLDDERGLVETNPEVIGANLIGELGTYTLDATGNLLVSDWATGIIHLLNGKYELQGSVGSAGECEPSYMATFGNTVYVGCKQSLQVKAFKYIEDEDASK